MPARWRQGVLVMSARLLGILGGVVLAACTAGLLTAAEDVLVIADELSWRLFALLVQMGWWDRFAFI